MARLYTVERCEPCEGEGVSYHAACELPCEHDEACRSCHGLGYVVRRVSSGFDRLIAESSGTLFRSRAAAEEWAIG